MCKRSDRPYMDRMALNRDANMQQLAEGRERRTINATRAAESRCRSTNHIATLTQFTVNMGALLQQAMENNEDVTMLCRDLYLSTMTKLTTSFGRILPSNRCVERSIFQLHHQIKELVKSDVIQCSSPTDPVLMEEDEDDENTEAFQLMGVGPVAEPRAMLPPYEDPGTPAAPAAEPEPVMSEQEDDDSLSTMAMYAALRSGQRNVSLAQREFDFM